MATPHVTGLAALIKSQDINRSWIDIKNLILSGGEITPSMGGITITGRRINAEGSLSCSNTPVFSVLKYPLHITLGTPETISALSINCASPAGPVNVTLSGSEVIALQDNGVAPDLTAGDGIFTGTWTPTRTGEILTFASASGTETISTPLLNITTASLSGATVGRAYSHVLTAEGGLPAYTWSVISGTLPDGLTLNISTGEISGTPAAMGVFSFNVKVTDSFGATKTAQLYISVNDYVWSSGSGKAIAVDREGNVLVAGHTCTGAYPPVCDFFITKYDQDDNVLWTKTTDGGGNNEYATAITVDSSGTIYVAGTSDNDYLTVKYDSTGTVLAVWRMNNGGNNDEAYGIAVDSIGNVYVTGHSNYNYYTVKYAASGNILWTKTYTNGIAYAVTVDSSGNVFVTGSGGHEYLTIKYDSSGSELWSRRYTRGDYDDYAYGIAVDGSGNVYVTGESSNGIDADYLTIKYNASGTLQWTRTHNCGSEYSLCLDAATGIAVDAYGSIFVTGSSNDNYLTIKYDAGGNILWSQTYDSGGNDWAEGIAVDSTGNVFVTGRPVTIKYRLPLTIETAAFAYGVINAPFSQNVFVTGGKTPYSWSIASGSLPPGLTLNSTTGMLAGTPSAAGVYSFTVRVLDDAGASVLRSYSLVITFETLMITTPSLPNAVVGTPYSQSLSGAGGRLPYIWSIISGSLPAGLYLNSSTGVISGTPNTPGTISFTIQLRDADALNATKTLSISGLGVTTTLLPTGNVGELYNQTLTAAGAESPYTWAVSSGTLPFGLTLDSATGLISGTPGISATFTFTVQATDLLGATATKTLSIDVNSFETVFSKIHDGGYNDYGYSVAYDSGGNVYVTGCSNNGTNDDYFTIKYDASGNVVWTQSFDSGSTDIAKGVAADEAGNVFVTGYSHNGSNYDYYTIKYDSSGTLLWNEIHDGGSHDYANGIAVDSSGNVHVTGTSNNDPLTIKYDATGNVLWARALDGGRYSNAYSIAVDANGNVYVAGVRDNGYTYVETDDFLLIKYNASGYLLWVQYYDGNFENGHQFTRDRAYAVAVDRSGNVYVTGMSRDFFNYGYMYYYLTLKYASSGSLVWAKHFSGDGGRGIATDNDGSAYVTGYSSNGSNSDYRIIKYDASGNLVWTKMYDGGSHDFAYGIAVDATRRDIYVTGASHNGANYDFLTVKYHLRYDFDITTASLPFSTTRMAYSRTLAVEGGSVPYTWSIVSGSLPGGLGLNNATGVISGTPAITGMSAFTVKVRDANGLSNTRPLSISVFTPLAVATTSLPAGIGGVTYSQTVIASGGRTPYTCSVVSGALPAGVMLNSTTCDITGTPAVIGTFDFTIQVRDANDTLAQKPLSLTINYLTVTIPSLPFGITGDVYNQTLTAGGGQLPYTWSISSGSLPAGLTLNSATGIISGTPATTGVFNFTAQLMDATSFATEQTLSIAVYAPLSIATASVFAGFINAAYSQTLAATGGLPPYVWSIESGSLPEGIALDSASGMLYGTPTATGNFLVTVKVTDAVSVSSTKHYAIGIYEVPSPVEWAIKYDSGSYEYASGVAVDGSGNVYTTGSSYNGSNYDCVTIKYDASGNTLWIRTYISGNDDTAAGVAVDSSGNVYVAGDSCSDTYCSALIIKYNASGNAVWTKTYRGSYGARGDGIALDSSGNIYVSGAYRSNAETDPDYLTLKYNSNGYLIWARTYNGGYFDFATDIAVDSSSNVYVTGESYNGSDNDILTIKYTSSGSLVWTAVYNSTGWDYGEGIAADQSGNVYVTGGSSSGGGTDGYLTIKYSSSGAQLWSRTFTEFYANSRSHAVAVSNDNLVYVAGESSYDYLTLRYDTQGNELGSLSYVSASYDTARDVAVSSGNVYVTGYSDSDFLTVRYNFGLKIVSGLLDTGIVGSFYGQTLAATGNTPPYSWSITSGSLPGGLSLDSSTGAISGTPSAAGTFSFTVQARDAASSTLTKQFTITILDISPPSLPAGMIGMVYSQTLTAAGGTAPYSWAVASGSLPDGLTLNNSTGLISGAPATAGTFNFTVQMSDAALPSNATTKLLSIAIYDLLTIDTSSLPDGMANRSYSKSVTAAGGKTPYTWAVASGSLPDGLTLNNSTGLISGAPATAGTFNFTVQVSDAALPSNARTKLLSIAIYDLLTIDTSSLPDGMANRSYSKSVDCSRRKDTLHMGYHFRKSARWIKH